MEFSIWLASKQHWVHMTKDITLPVIPRVGEFIKFHSEELGDYFPWKITQITYRESGKIEVWTELFDNIDNRMYSFEDDDEYYEYYEAYLAEGWIASRGVKVNQHYKNKYENMMQEC